MSPYKLFILRSYNLTFGRFPFFSQLLKKILIRVLIKKANERYVASSGYFDWDDMNAD